MITTERTAIATGIAHTLFIFVRIRLSLLFRAEEFFTNNNYSKWCLEAVRTKINKMCIVSI